MSGTVFSFPSAPATGDLVTNPTTGAVYVFDGTKWLSVPGGARVTIGATAPTDPKAGDFWYDIDAEVLKLYDGTQWFVAGGGGGGRASIGTTEPTNPTAGDLWWHPDDAKLYLWTAAEWVIVVNTPNAPLTFATRDYVDQNVANLATRASVERLPLSFSFPGRPGLGATLVVCVAQAATIAVDFAGSTSLSLTPANTNTAFAISRVSAAGVVTQLGSVMFLAGTSSGVFAGDAVDLAEGDALRIVAPMIMQDDTLADVAISVLTRRV